MIPPVNIKNSRRANPFGSLSFVSISLSFQIDGYLREILGAQFYGKPKYPFIGFPPLGRKVG